MARFLKDRTAAKGQRPGSLVLIGTQKMEHPVIQVMDFDTDNLTEKELKSIDEVVEYIQSDQMSWINIYGIHDTELMQKIADIFQLHPIFMEDIMDTDQTPRYEDGDTYEGFILKMLSYDDKVRLISAEQISIILGEKFVLTLQEQTGDVFNPIRERIRNTLKRSRLIDSDYFVYALLDTIVDNYIVIIETLGRHVEAQEEELFSDPEKSIVQEIYKLKTELSFLRKSVRPVREMMGHLMRSEHTLFKDKYITFLRDLNDMVQQAADAIELYSGMISDHLNIYHTVVSNRTNEVMKVLTIFASIFIPLTFLAGIYGMNFEYLPELKFHYSYPIFWGVVILVGVGLLIYFKRKKWL
ncbi:MAG: magnesium/cobalt transporter CorA [Bacteroidales bacterium]